MLELTAKTTELARVGKANYRLLRKLGLETIRDLIFYLPYRYDDFSQVTTMANLKADTKVNVKGTIELIQSHRSFKKKMFLTEALVSDGRDTIKVIWFNQPFLTRVLKAGDQISLAGKVSNSYGQLSLISPSYEKIQTNKLIHTSGLIPNYHITEKLSQKQLRSFVKQALSLVAEDLPDWIPNEIRERLKLLDIKTALKKIHSPNKQADILQARERFAFSELFRDQIKVQLIKAQLKNRQAEKIEFKKKETKKFISSLPFILTDDQKKVAWEIIKDLERTEPMSRLLSGDVGSGKTLVAIIALLNVALNKRQAVLMAPTEILAQQHFQYVSQLLAEFKLKIGLMTGQTKPKDYNKLDIIIGTHALIQKKVKFKNLALAIVDEQHRFGVEQRKRILDFNSEPNKAPHFLSMTATPIPRSLALTIYGDLDISTIKELPPGRKKTITKIVNEDKRQLAYQFIEKEIEKGHQAFIICPLIDESDKLGVKSVKKEHQKLSNKIFPKLKIGILHGRLKPVEKEKIMLDFLNKKIQILVSTSITEVGINIPNATIMVIEGAERFGLAQLHQFRGRVGRSKEQSYCLLFPSKEIIDNQLTNQRLKALTNHYHGADLAGIDLKLRGAGEIYGSSQSGFPELQFSSLTNLDLIKKAKDEAIKLIKIDPNLENHPLIANELGEWEDRVHLE